jgi:CHAD domain-containing protein
MENRNGTSLNVQLRHQLQDLHRNLDQSAAALNFAVTPTAIHKTRVAARRLRVLLHAYRREFDSNEAKRFRRELKLLTRDLEAAREADVTRHVIAQVAKTRDGTIGRNSRALHRRAVKQCAAVLRSLRLTIAAAPWQQRLRDLRQLAGLSSLVKENRALAAKVMDRVVKRRRRRLRDALGRAGRRAKRFHKIRLKVKAMRYLLESGLPKTAIATSLELKRLRQIQTCLGDMHDEENVLKSLGAEPTHREAARELCKKLKTRKGRHIHAFKGHRKELMRIWESAALRRSAAHPPK